MSTHNIGFYEDLTKLSLNYHQISSNMHLIFSARRVVDGNFGITFIFLYWITCFGYMNLLELLCPGDSYGYPQDMISIPS